MKKILHYLILTLAGIIVFSCKKSGVDSKITKPLVTFVVDKGTVTSGGTQIILGPEKDYEQGSDVVYTFTVVSGTPLTKFIVNSSSDVVSPLSKVLKTEPEGAIDTEGNFTQPVKTVKFYYAYRIDPLVPTGSAVTLAFSFQNESGYASTVSHDFTVIKAGSTLGKKLQVIDFSWPRRESIGIGTQDNFNIVSGIKSENNVRLQLRRPPFFSFDLVSDIGWQADDAIANADKIDLVGFRARYASTNPSVALTQFYVVSPSYTELLTHTYVGSQYMNLALIGTSGTARITAAGLTLPVTYTTNVNTTATNFVNTNKAAFVNKGLNLTASNNTLIWTVATAPAVGGIPYGPVTIVNLTGDLTGNPSPQQSNSTITELKNRQLADCILNMDAKLKAEGKSLRVVRFKRLDNITGAGRVTVSDFNGITYDNEFATLLAGIETTGKLYTDALGFSQIWGFAMSDGRKGMLRTIDNTYTNPVTGASTSPDLPTGGNYVLFGVIKVQKQ